MHLTAISPLDGRYYSKVSELQNFFSETALMYYRTYVEIEWFIFLCNNLKLANTRILKKQELLKLRKIYDNFDEKSAQVVKNFEKTTNHDVKAVEYFIKQNLEELNLSELKEFVHFACTSEDINNLAYALMVQDGLEEPVMESLELVIDELMSKSIEYSDVPMLSRTHGQTASPTVMGKEFMNFVKRLETQLKKLNNIEILGKINGAVGNYNAHSIAYPEIDWINASSDFVKILGLVPNLYTTQIEPHDFLAEIFDCMRRINTILIDLDRDIWSYISLGYFKQKLKDGEVGSSTMPHKVNPIDFENSEGNLGMANAMFSHFSEKLPISRLQRDLTDSTVLRNIGSAFAYSLLSYKSLLNGLKKLEINREIIEKDLEDSWEVLTEAIQTVMRKYKIENPYEKLKSLSRGKKITKSDIQTFIKTLELPESEKKRLLSLTPATYIGLAHKLIEV